MTLPTENVQDYPRPPALERVDEELLVILGGQEVARSSKGWRVCETHHAPTYYLPLDDIDEGTLSPASGRSYCEWKGVARYWTVAVGNVIRKKAAWSYPEPTAAFAPIADHLAFYAAEMELCSVGGQAVTPQPGDFYGGWVTPNLTGQIKGAPGTRHW